jgi:acyl-CoA synthetase (AMP-forming)/AMP-acid ligase II
MERSTELVVAILATIAAGACPCPLEPRLGRDETERRYRVARLGWTLLDPAHREAPSLAGVPSWRCLEVADLPAAAPYWENDLPSDAAGFLLFTSGSSGKPKGVVQNHRGMLTNARGVAAHTRLDADDRLLHVMPLHHTNGVNNQLLAPLLAGAAVILVDRFRAEAMPELISRHKPTIFTGVPTMYARMLEHDFPAENLSSLRMLRCGSAPITEELHRRVEAKFGIPLVVSYGLSEATCTSTMNPPGERRIGSVGTPLDGQDVYLRDSAGHRLPSDSGQHGEICISGPILMSGYLDETSDGEPHPLGEELRTGDLGRFDSDGYVFITGRTKDVIIRGGENLSPNLIEEVLSSVPGVVSCCVVGRPDPDLGEVPVAFVVRGNSTEGRAIDALRLEAAILRELSRIHQPAEYRFIDALPENSVGKVDRKRLADSLC